MVNGQAMDYSALNCPHSDSLDADYPAMCLPYQNGLNPLPNISLDVFGIPNIDARDRDATFQTPGNNTLTCGSNLETATGSVWVPSTCAMNAPGTNSPICEGYVDRCKFSTPKTRECKSDKCKEWQKKTRCSGDDCNPDYGPDNRAPHPEGYPGSDPTDQTKCTKEDSALQWLSCGIPCPVKFAMDIAGGDLLMLAICVIVFIVVSGILGGATILFVKGDPQNFFVAGRSLPFFVIFATLGSQLFDSSASLGNLDLAYAYHWWDGAAFPIGLALSLILNGIFFAKPLNEMKLLTLPDLFGRRYGQAAEVLVSCITLVSFCFLLAGNLVGCGKILSFLFNMSDIVGIVVSTALIWAYSCAGGLFSVAYTDVFQAVIGWTGFIVGSIWIQSNMPTYAGVSPAYPLGDKPIFGSGIHDADSYDPVPNAIVLNWATILVLGFGNLMALDFQARVFAAKTPRIAVMGCIAAGFLTGGIGVLNTFNSGSIRALYGPSSPHAEFVANSCSADITIIGCFGSDGPPNTCNAIPVNGVPTCGEWKPDPQATLKMLTCWKPECHHFLDFDGSAGFAPGTEGNYPMNPFIGSWIIMAIVAASMSTADGAIVAMGTVFSHNLLRKGATWMATDSNLLKATRWSTLLWAIASCLIAVTKPNETGYFLLVAFDIVLAGGVVPLFAAVYWKNIKPIAGFTSLLGGTALRAVLEFTLPKDGLLLLAGKFARSFGPGVAADPEMFDISVMGPNVAQVCAQEQLEDWTGVDSLLSPVFSLILLVTVQLLPIPNPAHRWFQPVPFTDPDDAIATCDDKVEPAAEVVGSVIV
ncbi:unnamed protein product [Polarella glacialis]|uniref:Solute carrier family 5 member 8 n=1 Tax=Polarella glacialis TaxID=89957 RepID=A0A813JME5_POLGL|nr:unnamed protein product [Polarella glacialis]